jgi:hypothetical protein
MVIAHHQKLLVSKTFGYGAFNVVENDGESLKYFVELVFEICDISGGFS